MMKNSNPTEVVHVGDDLTSDVSGARGMGFRTVWFCPPSRQSKLREAGVSQLPVLPPDATVSSLPELVAVLAVWLAEPAEADP